MFDEQDLTMAEFHRYSWMTSRAMKALRKRIINKLPGNNDPETNADAAGLGGDRAVVQGDCEPVRRQGHTRGHTRICGM